MYVLYGQIIVLKSVRNQKCFLDKDFKKCIFFSLDAKQRGFVVVKSEIWSFLFMFSVFILHLAVLFADFPFGSLCFSVFVVPGAPCPTQDQIS